MVDANPSAEPAASSSPCAPPSTRTLICLPEAFRQPTSTSDETTEAQLFAPRAIASIARGWADETQVLDAQGLVKQEARAREGRSGRVNQEARAPEGRSGRGLSPLTVSCLPRSPLRLAGTWPTVPVVEIRVGESATRKIVALAAKTCEPAVEPAAVELPSTPRPADSRPATKAPGTKAPARRAPGTRAPGTKPTLESAFRRWLSWDLRAPVSAGEPGRLTYEVYTSEQLAASARLGAPRASAPPPPPAMAALLAAPASVALHLCAIMFGICVVVGTVLAVVAVSGDDASPRSFAPAEQSLGAVPGPIPAAAATLDSTPATLAAGGGSRAGRSPRNAKPVRAASSRR